MPKFSEPKDVFDGILLLSKEEQQDPMGVIEQFFTDYRLHECRHTLWMMIETCLTTDNTSFQEASDRGDLLHRCKDIERLMEAGTLLLQKP